MLRPRAPLVPVSLAATLVCLAQAWTCPALAQAAQEAAHAISIPAQPLETALNELARQAGLQLMSNPADVAGKRAPAVAGSLTARQALDRLLAGSGLAADLSGREVVIRPAGGDPRGAAQLAPVVVSAALPSTTEGTGSYTTRAIALGKGERSLRETPQSVSVVTRQRLDDQNLSTLGEAMRRTTGMKTTSYGTGTDNIAARGYDLNHYQLDGTPVKAGSGSWSSDFLDLAMFDRIEVWRGPAGMLQGSGDPGGTVNLARKRAPLERTVQGAAYAGSWDNYRNEIDVGGALSEDGRLRGRFVNAVQDRKYFTDYLWSRKVMSYGTLEYDFTGSTTLSLAFTRQDGRSRPFYGVSTEPGRLPRLRRGTFMGADWNHKKEHLNFYLAELDHRLDNGGQARLTATMLDRDSFGENNSWGNSPIDPATGNVSMMPIAIRSDERDIGLDGFVSTPFQALGRRHEVLLGAAFQRSSGGSAYNSANYGENQVPQNIYDPDVHIPKPELPVGPIPDLVTTESALYGQARLQVAEPLTVILGARLSRWEARDHDAGTRQLQSSELTPYAGLIFDLNRNFSLYGSYATIYQPQSARDAQGKYLDPREGAQAEIGLKGEFLDQRLTSHLALYTLEDRNRAMADPDVPLASIAAGKVRSQGFEAELGGEILPGWELTAGYAYTTTKYLKAPRDQQGKPFASEFPRHNFTLWSKYRFSSRPLSGLSLGAGLRVVSEATYEESGYTWRQPGYAVVDAQIGYALNRHVDVTLSVNNLFDRYYYDRIGTARQVYFGEPRSAMLALRWRL